MRLLHMNDELTTRYNSRCLLRPSHRYHHLAFGNQL